MSILKRVSEALKRLFIPARVNAESVGADVGFGETGFRARPSIADAVRVIVDSGAKPHAIEAIWDGDTNGWFVCLAADCATLIDGRETRLDLHLGVFEDGGDIRLFNGQVPPWPEAVAAKTVGTAVAQHFGVPFYFPSPVYPEAYCPRWHEQQLATPCGRCGIPLLQGDACPWRGVCSQCSLENKRKTPGSVIE